MDISLEGFFEWFQEQARYGLFIVLIVCVIYFAIKRAWIGMIGSLVGLAFVAIFILNPEMITSVSSWFGGLINLEK